MIDIFTCVTQNHPGYINFKSSFELYKGWKVTRIGMGMRWKGWISRMKLYMQTALWVSKHRHPKHLILFLDGYDIMCIRDSDQFEETFQKIGYPMVAGYESLCFFMNCRSPHVWQTIHKQPNTYINGGCLIGEAHAIYEAFRWCIEHGYTKDDQIALSHYMDAFPHQIILDKEHRFVYNDLFSRSGKYKFQSQEPKIILLHTTYQPYFIHFPGMMAFQSSVLLNPLVIGKTPKNYQQIGKHLLGADFISTQPIQTGVYQLTNMVLLSAFLLILLIFWFRNSI